jgi:NADH dehydrogenase
VVVIGGGFGGLLAARSLRRAPVRVTLVDRRNHHLFQPLLYQVATGGLSPANIAAPLRSLLKRQRDTEVRLGEVVGFDLGSQRVLLATGEQVPYDSLIVASGAGQSYFGHDEWRRRAPGLKSLEDATRVRRRVLLAFEQAEIEVDPERRRRLLTFVVVGAGPTGVELAGALAEVSRKTLRHEFRRIDPTAARVLLVEGAGRVLPPFPEPLSERARHSLEKLGVEVRTGWMVERITDGEIEIARAGGDGGGEADREDDGGDRQRIATANVLWAAGVEASPLGAALARASGAELDRTGRVVVGPDCCVPGHPNVFVVGDLAHFAHGLDRPLPGLAPVAMQQGRYVAKVIRRRFQGRATPPFRYVDKGNMATIGRKKAVAEIGRFRFWGLPAWLAWLFVHLLYLAEFQNRVLVLVQWGWNYFTRNRSARLITAEPRDYDLGDALDPELGSELPATDRSS